MFHKMKKLEINKRTNIIHLGSLTSALISKTSHLSDLKAFLVHFIQKQQKQKIKTNFVIRCLITKRKNGRRRKRKNKKVNCPNGWILLMSQQHRSRSNKGKKKNQPLKPTSRWIWKMISHLKLLRKGFQIFKMINK